MSARSPVSSKRTPNEVPRLSSSEGRSAWPGGVSSMARCWLDIALSMSARSPVRPKQNWNEFPRLLRRAGRSAWPSGVSSTARYLLDIAFSMSARSPVRSKRDWNNIPRLLSCPITLASLSGVKDTNFKQRNCSVNIVNVSKRLKSAEPCHASVPGIRSIFLVICRHHSDRKLAC